MKGKEDHVRYPTPSRGELGRGQRSLYYPCGELGRGQRSLCRHALT